MMMIKIAINVLVGANNVVKDLQLVYYHVWSVMMATY